ncbi:hypothetical protein GCM10009863_35360 [Streptomyces axinellae]|uniref:Mutator family transposase n=1 Tax=Streptomyces axinellae TaxID=552788 RepID=A0ABP6CJ30_9ACTN
MALAVTTEGRREILGLWADDGGEGAEHRPHLLTEIKNRGLNNVLMLVCDGLKGLPEGGGPRSRPPRQPPYALMRQHAQDEPPRLSTLRPGIPEALERVVTEPPAKDPDDRPDGHALVSALDGMGPDSAAAGRPRRRPGRRHGETRGRRSRGSPEPPRRPLTRVLPTRRLPGPLRRVRWARSYTPEAAHGARGPGAAGHSREQAGQAVGLDSG